MLAEIKNVLRSNDGKLQFSMKTASELEYAVFELFPMVAGRSELTIQSDSRIGQFNFIDKIIKLSVPNRDINLSKLKGYKEVKEAFDKISEVDTVELTENQNSILLNLLKLTDNDNFNVVLNEEKTERLIDNNEKIIDDKESYERAKKI